MKKIYFTVLSVLLICSVSCRKEGDFVRNPNDFMNIAGVTNLATESFENVWATINTGYVFWDITDVDWDQRYREYKPKFEEIDAKLFDYATTAEYVKDIQPLYDGLVSGLKDGHMVVMVGTDKSTRTFSSPSNQYNKERAHSDGNAAEFRNKFLSSLAKNEKVTQFDSCYFIYDSSSQSAAGHASCVYTLSDGRKVPYLWNRSFADTSSIKNFILEGQDPVQVGYAEKWKPIYDRFIDNLVNTPRSELGGVILDLRADGGGSMSALPNYINIFAGEEHTYWETRYKEGMGRYDMSAWVPFRIGMPKRYRDCAAEDIPVVVLCDVNSVSSAEITAGSIKQMPTAHLIGERTWGGHGPLSGRDNSQFNATYGGVSGSMDMSLRFFVYTSNYENRPVGGPVLEGTGITPDEEVLYKDAGYQGQFDAAIRYLESQK